MNKLFFLVMICFMHSCLSEVKEQGKPILALDKDTINMGNIPIGDSIIIDVKISNIGNDTLKILSIGYSCGCTQGGVNRKNILPRDYDIISIKYLNSEDREDIFKTIILENNSDNPFKMIVLKGTSR